LLVTDQNTANSSNEMIFDTTSASDLGSSTYSEEGLLMDKIDRLNRHHWNLMTDTVTCWQTPRVSLMEARQLCQVMWQINIETITELW